MALQPVTQVSHTGCFFACVAMLLETTYEKAFNLLRPGVDMRTMDSHGFMGTSMEEVAHTQLQKIGIQSHTGKYRKFRSYSERMSKNAIMIIRWSPKSTSCHCVLFDAAGKRFIDPSGGYIVDSKYELRTLQRRLEVPIVIDKIPQHLKALRDIRRDAPPYRTEWGGNSVEQDTHDIDDQVLVRTWSSWNLGAEGNTSIS